MCLVAQVSWGACSVCLSPRAGTGVGPAGVPLGPVPGLKPRHLYSGVVVCKSVPSSEPQCPHLETRDSQQHSLAGGQ